MDIFQKRLKELRGSKSKIQIAKEIGITAQTYGRYENGERKPDIEALTMLSKYFGVSSDYLLGLSDVASVDVDIQTACKVTGLSEKAVTKLNYIYTHADEYTTSRLNCISDSLDKMFGNYFVFDVVPAVEVISKLIGSKYFEILIGDAQIYDVMSKSEDKRINISEDLFNKIKINPIEQAYNYFITPQLIAETKLNHAAECIKRIVKAMSVNKEAENNGKHNTENE